MRPTEMRIWNEISHAVMQWGVLCCALLQGGYERSVLQRGCSLLTLLLKSKRAWGNDSRFWCSSWLFFLQCSLVLTQFNPWPQPGEPSKTILVQVNIGRNPNEGLGRESKTKAIVPSIDRENVSMMLWKSSQTLSVPELDILVEKLLFLWPLVKITHPFWSNLIKTTLPALTCSST